MYALTFPQETFITGIKPLTRAVMVIAAIVFFTGQSLTMNAYETGETLKGYIYENTVVKEHSNDALFLLKEKRHKELIAKYGKNNVRTLDEGVTYIKTVKPTKAGPVRINILEIDRRINPDIEILPELSKNNAAGRTKINEIAKKSKAIAAVNGTYFKQDTGVPLGTLVINNEIISGPIYSRAALMIFDDKFEAARISFNGKIKSDETEVKINNINQPRMLASEVIIYNNKWGNRSPSAKKPERNIAVQNNKVITVADIPLSIPEKGYVIAGPKEVLKSLGKGKTIEIEYSLNNGADNAKHVISGGPFLVRRGNIFTDISDEKLNAIAGKNPRTAVGYTKDNVFIMVTADGRKENSSGLTVGELAAFMKSIGCYEAINLDGGSSTVMYASGNVYSGNGLKGSVPVNNALVVRKKV